MSPFDVAVITAAVLMVFVAATGVAALAVWRMRGSRKPAGAPQTETAFPVAETEGRRGRRSWRAAIGAAVLLALLTTTVGVWQIYRWRTAAGPSGAVMEGLVSRWHADGNALDAAGGNNGTLHGGAGYTAGKFGQAFALGQSYAAVTVGNPANLQLQNCTITAWIKRGSTSLVTYDPEGDAVIFGYGDHGYSLAIHRDGTLFLTKIGINGNEGGARVADTSFHHVAMTKAGSEVVFYVDGQAFRTAPYFDTFEFTTVAAIGARADIQGNTFFGAIDEVSIYKRALAESEIKSLARGEVAGGAPPLAPGAVNRNGLVSWWHADANAEDAVGGNNGTLQGGAGYTRGKFGQAFWFTQDRQAVLVGNPGNLQLQDFTIVEWIKRGSASFVSADPDPGYQGDGEIFSYGAGGYGFIIRGNGTLILSKIGYDHVDSSVSITDTEYHFVAVAKSGTSVVFYVDGAAYPAPYYSTLFEFSTPAAIGARGDNLHNGFIGAIDEILVYSRALSQAEIKTLASGGTAGASRPKPLASANTNGLVSWWHADGNALDAVGGIDGTLSGTTRFGPGRIGEGFVFDGNGVVELGHPAKLQLQDFTVEAWVKRSRTTQTSPTPGGGEILSCGHNGYAIGMTDDGLLYLSAMEVSAVYSSVLITDLQFHHLAVTKSGQSVAFYIDGVFDRKVTYAGTFSFETALAIGGRGDAGGRFMGTIDELSVHDRALSAQEIQADYQAAAKEELPAPGAVIRLEAPMASPRTTEKTKGIGD